MLKQHAQDGRSVVAKPRGVLAAKSNGANAKVTRLYQLFCALMAALGVLATYPVLESGFCDDFSYAKTTLDLVKTGHLIYNGWATAMLGWQVYWGALIIKLFGFSFLALHLSTLPFAMGSAVLLFSICQRVGLDKSNSTICALTLVLSPVYIPVAASFMTDVPAEFWILVCLYSCIRAVTADGVRSAVAWLILCTLVSLMAGTGRQTAWLGALVMVPSAAWLLRSYKSIPRIAAALWVLSFAVVLLCIRWFEQQPYSVPEHLTGDHESIVALSHNMAFFVFTTLLFSLPALAGYLPILRRNWRKQLPPLLLLLAALLYAGVVRGRNVFAPWLMGMVMPMGVDGNYDILGSKPVVLHTAVRAIITIFLAAVVYSAVSFLFIRVGPASVRSKGGGSLPWTPLMWLLGPFTLAYLALMLPRAASQSVLGVAIFDRYTIPLIPVVAIVALRFYQEQIRPGASIFAVLTLGAFSLFAVAYTHDYFAMERAVVAASSSLVDAGIPRTAIQASFEYDGWTEMESTGHLNDPRVVIPKGAYHAVSREGPPHCRFWFADHTPSVKPTYLVVSSSLPCLVPTAFASIPYKAWLPPFQREILIRKFVESRYYAAGKEPG